jgi:predicted nucleotidyltransferase component of viral defense system
MIKASEIQIIARETGVRDSQIEKDYILSWILQGIANHKILSTRIVFKGGTVLKKVYFEDYRFSEDLDFTLLEESTNEQIYLWFNEVFEYIHEEANITLEIVDDNEHDDGGINFYVSYIGPLGGFRANKRIKIDIARSEKLEFAPILRPAITKYSDSSPHQLLGYPLEEIIVEKLRAVMQRMQARDYYDIWYLLEIHGIEPEFYVTEFKNKCASKNLRPGDFYKKLAERIPSYKGRWETSLAEQIQDLPDFAKVEREVQRGLRKFKP